MRSQFSLAVRVRVAGQEAPCGWVVVLTIAHIQQASDFIHQRAEACPECNRRVTKLEIACAVSLQRVALANIL